MMLAAGPGTALEVVAEGPDAEAAVDAVAPSSGTLQRSGVGPGQGTVALQHRDG